MRVGKDIIRRSNVLHLNVVDPNSHVLLFKFRSLKPLKSLLNMICKIKDIKVEEASFSYKDKLVLLKNPYTGDWTTPEDIGEFFFSGRK